VATATSPQFLTTVTVACATPPADPARLHLVPNTIVELDVIDPVGSKTSKAGDLFELRTRDPLVVDGIQLVPAGAFVQGQVVHAAPNKFGGAPGELILAARYVQLPEGRLRLKSAFGLAGKNRRKTSAAVALLVSPIAAAFIQGTEIYLPRGAPLSARLGDPVSFRCRDAATPVLN
jgi:hypothetical protein